jgi:hypothetical protein
VGGGPGAAATTSVTSMAHTAIEVTFVGSAALTADAEPRSS